MKSWKMGRWATSRVRCRLTAMQPMNSMQYVVVIVAFILTGVTTPAARALETFPVASLTIETKAGAQKISVEVATTPKQYAQGLMYRREMASDAGMVFVYQRAGKVSMWMKNTLIPLDMVFIDDSGKITKIVERTTPMSLDIISSGGPVRGVLELNGGTTSRLGVKAGDRVTLSGVFD
jgi:uncharacterized protein